jgi:RNA polymerase sigma-70 factor (ECF subfamily)
MLGSGVPSIDYKPGPKMRRSVLELRGTRGQERCEPAFHIRGGRKVALNQEGLSQRSDEVPICDGVQIFCVFGNFLAACDITDYERDFRGLQSWRKVAPTMISDEALMLEFQGGSRAAFEQLFARYRGPLYGYFRRRLNGDRRAEDLTQETFLAVIRAAAHYEARALVRTYLFAIAMNLLAAERRKRFRDSPQGQPSPEPATTNAPDAAVWVRQALEKLDESEREILMLREYEQLNYAEIAELLKVPVNTVRSRLFRARMAMKGYLEPTRKVSDAAAIGDAADNVKLARAEGEAI